LVVSLGNSVTLGSVTLERFLYFGSDEIAVPTLEALAEREQVLAVLTQPDRPSGRKRKLTPCPVKARALELGLQVLDPEKVGEVSEQLQDLQPDLAVVFAYGQYMPRSIFELPRHGSINLHPSLLPKYRGASPIQSALLDGLEESGISILKVSAKMDAGDLLLQRRVSMGEEDDGVRMRQRFASLGAELILEALEGLREERLSFVPQDEAEATECGKLSKEDGLLDWKRSAESLRHQVRGCQPWPGTWFELENGERIKVFRVRIEAATAKAGTLLELKGDGPLIATGEGALRLLELQPPGKSRMDGRSFMNGYGRLLPEMLP